MKPDTYDGYRDLHRPADIPTDSRPYRRASADGGDEVQLDGPSGIRHTFRQIGWHGQTGAFYALDEDPSQHEPGSFTPLWLPVGSEPILAEEPAVDMDLQELREAGHSLGQMFGRAHAARDIFNRAYRDAYRDELDWAGLPTKEEQARADAEKVIRDVAAAFGPTRPTVVVLCGSTRFADAFRETNLRETLAGRIVLSIGCDMRTDAELFAGMDSGELAIVKTNLDELHKRKIDLADEVLVLNVGGYVGESTRREIDYAISHGKRLRWLEPGQADTPETLAEWEADILAAEAANRAARAEERAHTEVFGTPTPARPDDEGETPFVQVLQQPPDVAAGIDPYAIPANRIGADQ